MYGLLTRDNCTEEGEESDAVVTSVKHRRFSVRQTKSIAQVLYTVAAYHI